MRKTNKWVKENEIFGSAVLIFILYSFQMVHHVSGLYNWNAFSVVECFNNVIFSLLHTHAHTDIHAGKTNAWTHPPLFLSSSLPLSTMLLLPHGLIYLPTCPSLSSAVKLNFAKVQHVLQQCFDSSTLKVISIERGDEGVVLLTKIAYLYTMAEVYDYKLPSCSTEACKTWSCFSFNYFMGVFFF